MKTKSKYADVNDKETLHKLYFTLQESSAKQIVLGKIESFDVLLIENVLDQCKDDQKETFLYSILFVVESGRILDPAVQDLFFVFSVTNISASSGNLLLYSIRSVHALVLNGYKCKDWAALEKLTFSLMKETSKAILMMCGAIVCCCMINQSISIVDLDSIILGKKEPPTKLTNLQKICLLRGRVIVSSKSEIWMIDFLLQFLSVNNPLIERCIGFECLNEIIKNSDAKQFLSELLAIVYLYLNDPSEWIRSKLQDTFNLLMPRLDQEQIFDLYKECYSRLKDSMKVSLAFMRIFARHMTLTDQVISEIKTAIVPFVRNSCYRINACSLLKAFIEKSSVDKWYDVLAEMLIDQDAGLRACVIDSVLKGRFVTLIVFQDLLKLMDKSISGMFSLYPIARKRGWIGINEMKSCISDAIVHSDDTIRMNAFMTICDTSAPIDELEKKWFIDFLEYNGRHVSRECKPKIIRGVSLFIQRPNYSPIEQLHNWIYLGLNCSSPFYKKQLCLTVLALVQNEPCLKENARGLLNILLFDGFDEVREMSFKQLVAWNLPLPLHHIPEMRDSYRLQMLEPLFEFTKIACKYDDYLVLLSEMEERIHMASSHLLDAAMHHPLHGLFIQGQAMVKTLSVIDQNVIEKQWSIFKSLLALLFPFLNSDSPEGYLPEEIDPSFSTNSQWISCFSWRAIKECCLWMQYCVECQTVDKSNVVQLGGIYISLLTTTMHCGAYSSIFPIFQSLCRMCFEQGWDHPKVWLETLLDEQFSQFVHLTRRSAGIPFIVLGIVLNDSKLLGSCILRCFEWVEKNMEIQTANALNILRAIVRESDLAEDITPWLGDLWKVSIFCYGSSIWSVRNSATMLFSCLFQRCFGNRRDRNNDVSMSATEFFNKFPIEESFSQELTKSSEMLMNKQSSKRLFPLCLILSRLTFSPLINSYVNCLLQSLVCPNIKIRWTIARCIINCIDDTNKHLGMCLSLLDGSRNANQVHGLLCHLLVLFEKYPNLIESHVVEYLVKFSSSVFMNCSFIMDVFLDLISLVVDDLSSKDFINFCSKQIESSDISIVEKSCSFLWKHGCFIYPLDHPVISYKLCSRYSIPLNSELKKLKGSSLQLREGYLKSDCEVTEDFIKECFGQTARLRRQAIRSFRELGEWHLNQLYTHSLEQAAVEDRLAVVDFWSSIQHETVEHLKSSSVLAVLSWIHLLVDDEEEIRSRIAFVCSTSLWKSNWDYGYCLEKVVPLLNQFGKESTKPLLDMFFVDVTINKKHNKKILFEKEAHNLYKDVYLLKKLFDLLWNKN